MTERQNTLDFSGGLNRLIRGIPLPICGLTLGLGALGNMLFAYSGLLYWSYGVITLVLWTLLLLKLVLYWPQAKQELGNPLALSVFEAFFMTLLQLVVYLRPYWEQLAFALWVVANAGHVALVIWFSLRYLRQFHLSSVYTTWNVLYGGNMLAAVLSPLFHMEQVGQIIFWVGLVLFLPWYPISAYRYWKLPVAEAALPTLCILAAPFNLMLAGYLSCIPEPKLLVALLIACIGQTMYVYVLINLPRVLRTPFAPSYGALTFPFVIPAVALQKLLAFFTATGVDYPAVLQTVLLVEQGLAVVLVTYALVRYLMHLKKMVCVA